MANHLYTGSDVLTDVFSNSSFILEYKELNTNSCSSMVLYSED